MHAVEDDPGPGRADGGEPGSEPESTPFAGLTPDRLLDALDSIGLRGDGRLLALNSYENRVYQVYLEDPLPADPAGAAVAVVKFYRAGRWTDAAIEEEHAFVAMLAGHEIPAVAPLQIGGRTLHRHGGFRFAVYPRRGGRAPELEDPAILAWLGRFVGRIHAAGAGALFASRPLLDIRSFGEEPREELLAGGFIPADLHAAYTSVVDQALQGVRAAFERAASVRSIRLHGDFHAGNILWTDRGPHIVDFDDARNGPAVQDLWMLTSGDRAAATAQIESLLEGYARFCDFDPVELQLIEPLRTLRIIHYAAWIARRWSDPAFPAAFPFFNTQRYWQDHVLALREQIAMMQESPIVLIAR